MATQFLFHCNERKHPFATLPLRPIFCLFHLGAISFSRGPESQKAPKSSYFHLQSAVWAFTVSLLLPEFSCSNVSSTRMKKVHLLPFVHFSEQKFVFLWGRERKSSTIHLLSELSPAHQEMLQEAAAASSAPCCLPSLFLVPNPNASTWQSSDIIFLECHKCISSCCLYPAQSHHPWLGQSCLGSQPLVLTNVSGWVKLTAVWWMYSFLIDRFCQSERQKQLILSHCSINSLLS